MATENIKVVKIDTQPAQTSVKDLRQELKALKDTLLSTEQGTEEYNKALQQAADIQHTLKEQTEELNASAMDFGQITGNIVKATGGLVAGLQAAKATMNLFGIENEDVIKSLEKMQNLMAITQALPSIDNGVKAFKRLGLAIKSAAAATGTLGKALMASGIGLAVAAVAALAANWDKVKIALGLATEKQKEYNLLVKGFTEQQEAEANVMKKAGQSDVEILRFRKKALEDNLKAEEDYIKHLEDERNEVLNMNLPANELARELSHIAAEMEGAGKNSEIFKEKLAEVNAELKIEEEVLARVWKRMIDIENASNKGILGVEKSLQEELNEKFAGKPLKIPVDFSFEQEEEADTSSADALKEKIFGTIESLRNAFVTPEEQYQQEIDALDLALKTKLIKEEEYLRLKDALEKEQTQNEILRYSTAAKSIGDIFSNLGDLMEEGSEEQKAFQIMGATVSMIAGIVEAISGTFTTHSGVWDIAIAAAQAAAIATAGAVNIAKIAQTNKNNAKSVASGAKSSTGALASINAPVQYTQDVQGASIEGAIKDTKVYVTETDITNTQNKVSVTENEARF